MIAKETKARWESLDEKKKDALKEAFKKEMEDWKEKTAHLKKEKKTKSRKAASE